MNIMLAIFLALCISLAQRTSAFGNEFRTREAQIAQYKSRLDSLGPNGALFWIRLDAKQRPHRLFVGEGFYRADFQSQQDFVETYSKYLAGHPEKFMLIDLLDGKTSRPVGEFGWGGFKLYSQPVRASAKLRE
ncbi:MAG: hypothetical protein HYV04_01280 [Deltaproteobacteria bacterium]|nr:hypothetical protein [Deltaproteobacteria bacterium]